MPLRQFINIERLLFFILEPLGLLGTSYAYKQAPLQTALLSPLALSATCDRIIVSP